MSEENGGSTGLTTGQMLRSQEMLKQLHERLPKVDAEELADEVNEITTEFAERYLQDHPAYQKAEEILTQLAENQPDEEKSAALREIAEKSKNLRLDNAQLQWFVALLVGKLKLVNAELREQKAGPSLYRGPVGEAR